MKNYKAILSILLASSSSALSQSVEELSLAYGEAFQAAVRAKNSTPPQRPKATPMPEGGISKEKNLIKKKYAIGIESLCKKETGRK